MERPLAQSQIAGRECLSQIPGFVRISVADGHVVMPDGELAHGGLVSPRHGELSSFGAWAIGTEDDGGGDQGAVAESGDCALAAFVEGNVGEIFAVLLG